MLIYLVPKDWNLMKLMPIPYMQRYYFKPRCTVLLNSKLPVASRFLRDENRVTCYTILIARNKNCVAQESLKHKFLA